MKSVAQDDLRAAYATLVPPFATVRVVGAARIGAYRVVKLRLAGKAGEAVVQARWVPSPAGWRVAAAEVLPG